MSKLPPRMPDECRSGVFTPASLLLFYAAIALITLPTLIRIF